jgi:hypothetical protein
MGTTMVDYVIAAINETQIMDVYEYAKKEAQQDDKPEFEG